MRNILFTGYVHQIIKEQTSFIDHFETGDELDNNGSRVKRAELVRFTPRNESEFRLHTPSIMTQKTKPLLICAISRVRTYEGPDKLRQALERARDKS